MGELGVTYALYLELVEKRVVDFLFTIIELFSLALTVETLLINRYWSESAFFKGVSHFQVEGDVASSQLVMVSEK